MVKRVRKLLYELSGQGSLFKGDEQLLKIPYDLKFFQEVIITGGGTHYRPDRLFRFSFTWRPVPVGDVDWP